MRKLLSMLFAIALIAGCNKGRDETSSITGYDSNKLKQTLYADQTGSGSGFTFTAAESWTTQVRDVTRVAASEQPWVTLNPAQGDAGTFTLTITLDPNYTGTDRKSEIRIVCGGTTITITVEQKGTTAEGETPDPDPTPVVKQIARIDVENSYQNDYSGTEYRTFRYDEDMLVEVITTETESYKGTLQHTWVTTTSIEKITQSDGGSGIAFKIKENVDGTVQRTLVEATAQFENGRVSSCSRKGKYYDKNEVGVPFNEQFTLSYDAAGYLAGCVRIELGNKDYTFYSTWLGGNYTKVVGDGESDEAIYGNTSYMNKANLDLNAYIVLDSEGFDFSFGEPDKIFALCGYTGRRSTNMATKVTEMWTGGTQQTTTYTYSYEFDADGYPTKIHARTSNNGNTYETTYTITYK